MNPRQKYLSFTVDARICYSSSREVSPLNVALASFGPQGGTDCAVRFEEITVWTPRFLGENIVEAKVMLTFLFIDDKPDYLQHIYAAIRGAFRPSLDEPFNGITVHQVVLSDNEGAGEMVRLGTC